MTVLEKSSSELLSELELGARKPRKVSVRRQPQGTVEERLANAKLAEVKAAVKEEADACWEARMNALKSQHIIDVNEANCQGYDKGVTQGRAELTDEHEDQFDDDVNSRICDRERHLPWAVGVIVAGEQHRILQALADYLDEFDQPGLSARGFAHRLQLPWYPEYTRAPDPITHHNCERPPKRGSQEDDMNISPYWTYYLEQLDED